jgi:hypothetical protein
MGRPNHDNPDGRENLLAAASMSSVAFTTLTSAVIR